MNKTEVKKIKSTETWGNVDMWKTLSKVKSHREEWTKETKALEIAGSGCLVQVTTQQVNADGSHSLAESITFVPDVKINTTIVDDKIVKRELVKYKRYGNA